MNIDYVFPHPIATVEMNEDNNALVKTIDELATEITEERAADYWDCKVITSFHDEPRNLQFASNHKDFISRVEQHVNDYMAMVGWYTAHLPNKVTSIWFNKYNTEDHFQEAHHHGSHEVCAVYYATDDLTPTQFYNPNQHTVHTSYDVCDVTEVTKSYHTVYAQKGKLVIFPGYMTHKVPYVNKKQLASDYTFAKNRITIAMNFGKYEKSILTKLKECDNL